VSGKAPGPGPGAEPLRIGGLEKLSAVDWPGMLAAVVFCQGCAWRCRYCHNTHLRPLRSESEIAWEWVVRWLGRRRGLLDAVVFSGGEATQQPGLAAALRQVRDLGFKAGLHTAGSDPEALRAVLPLLDWIGFDYKAPFASYGRITGSSQGDRAMRSLSLVIEAGVPCEVRTTWHPDLLSADELAQMGETLLRAGVGDWVIQRFRPEGCADTALCSAAMPQVPSFRRPEGNLKVTLR
jgi:pyruvate formate lyase activating enzyme